MNTTSDDPAPFSGRDRPRVTVVTPVLNGRTQIEACLACVAAQDLVDHEHLVVDGGSTDGTPAIVRAAAARDPRIRLVEGPDHGQSHAMNKGAVHANAPIIGQLNVDDAYAPGALRKAVEALEAAPVPSFFWGGLDVVDPAGRWYAPPGDLRPWKLLVGPDHHPFPLNPAAYFFHRALHATVGLYDETDHHAMDVDFLLRASFHVAQVLTTPDVLGEYRNLPGTKTYEDYEHGLGAARLVPIYERHLAHLPRARRVQVRAEQVLRRDVVPRLRRMPGFGWLPADDRAAPSHHRGDER